MGASMRVGWLQDDPGYLGGAELTMAEFRAAAPEGVDVIDCPPGAVDDCDTYVVGNRLSYADDEVPPGAVRYHHDITPTNDRDATHVFCSPLQRERMGGMGELIPPALDLSTFRKHRNSNHRTGAVCVGRMAYGKGLEMLAEFPEPVDVYSSVPVASERNARYRGAAVDVASVLAQYERFVFLPTALEPFGRAVVEAWAAGLELVVNRNVGALHWIMNDNEALDTAAGDFWELVCG